MNKITVNVTPKHIKKGRHLNAYECPIALALKDVGFKTPSVDGNEISCWTDKSCTVISTPKKAATFVKRFDTHQKVKPFSFILTVNECNS